MSEYLAVEEAARKYDIPVKRLRGAIWTNGLLDPIGSLETDQVVEDWRLVRFAERVHEQQLHFVYADQR